MTILILNSLFALSPPPPQCAQCLFHCSSDKPWCQFSVTYSRARQLPVFFKSDSTVAPLAGGSCFHCCCILLAAFAVKNRKMACKIPLNGTLTETVCALQSLMAWARVQQPQPPLPALPTTTATWRSRCPPFARHLARAQPPRHTHSRSSSRHRYVPAMWPFVALCRAWCFCHLLSYCTAFSTRAHAHTQTHNTHVVVLFRLFLSPLPVVRFQLPDQSRRRQPLPKNWRRSPRHRKQPPSRWLAPLLRLPPSIISPRHCHRHHHNK